MRQNRLKLSALFWLGIGLTSMHAQESFNATGGNASGNGGSASYSIGQVVYTTNTGTNGSEAQGVQQPYEISVAYGLEETNSINLLVSAYPNPTTDYLTLEVKEFELTNLYFQIYDMNGKLLRSEKTTGKQTNITMSNLLPAIYFVKVVQEDIVIIVFKIVKN